MYSTLAQERKLKDMVLKVNLVAIAFHKPKDLPKIEE